MQKEHSKANRKHYPATEVFSAGLALTPVPSLYDAHDVELCSRRPDANSVSNHMGQGGPQDLSGLLLEYTVSGDLIFSPHHLRSSPTPTWSERVGSFGCARHVYRLGVDLSPRGLETQPFRGGRKICFQ